MPASAGCRHSIATESGLEPDSVSGSLDSMDDNLSGDDSEVTGGTATSRQTLHTTDEETTGENHTSGGDARKDNDEDRDAMTCGE